MKLAVLADIHSNCFALEAVLRDMRAERPSAVLLLGDFFGYYPWAVETYGLLQSLDAIAVKGNHDILVLQQNAPDPTPTYWAAAKQNERELLDAAPHAIDWLNKLSCRHILEFAGRRIELCHGTPDDPVMGRYYPDDEAEYPWFPVDGAAVLLGHTHHPLCRRTPGGGLVVNPGSVGQSRSGDLRAHWGILDLDVLSFEPRLTTYDVQDVVRRLEVMAWDRRSIASLQKSYAGPLHI